jgi:hypothetical protein
MKTPFAQNFSILPHICELIPFDPLVNPNAICFPLLVSGIYESTNLAMYHCLNEILS